MEISLTADQIARFEKLVDATDNDVQKFVYLEPINEVMAYGAYLDEMRLTNIKWKNHIAEAEKTFRIMCIRYNEEDYKNAKNDVNLLEEKYMSKLDLLKSMLKERQEKCNHEMNEIAHDSHKRLYRCSLCGKEEWI